MNKEQEVYDRLIDRVHQVQPIIAEAKNSQGTTTFEVIEKVYEELKDTTSPLDMMIIASFVTTEIFPIEEIKMVYEDIDNHMNPN
jgi:hypothetical protein